MLTQEQLVTAVSENLGRMDLVTQIKSRLNTVQLNIVNKVASLGLDVPELRNIHSGTMAVGDNEITVSAVNKVRSTIGLELSSATSRSIKVNYFPYNIFVKKYNMINPATGVPEGYTFDLSLSKVRLSKKADVAYSYYLVSSSYPPDITGTSPSIIYGIDDCLISGTTAFLFKLIESPSANDWFTIFNSDIKDYAKSIVSIDVWAPSARGFQVVQE